MRPTSSVFRYALTPIVGILAATSAVAAPPRLPTDVVPVFQQIHLRTNADSASYSGWVKVDLDVQKPTPSVTLHADGQTIQKLTLTQSGKAISVKRTAAEEGAITLTASKSLARGPATLEIHFTKPYNTQAVGLYRVKRGDEGYLFTQFEATDARKAFPCWDEPSFKFSYQITLEIPESQQAITNVPVEKETQGKGWKTITFQKTPPMPSYLLAMSVGRLEFVDVPGTHVPTRIVTVKGQSQLAGLAVEATPPVIAALEKYFDMPYPYAKLDLIAVPEYWFGAMENPGAITFTESALLLDPASASTQSRRTLTRFLAHELAHMWFGDYVTMAWWDDLWLNESFADWMGDKITEQVAPQFQLRLGEMSRIQDIMATDARPSTDPIRNRAATGNDAMRAVGLAYNKGKAVLGMFEQWIGPDVFRQGVNEYLRAHAWKNAVAGDLWESLGKVSGKDVAVAMAGYIDQQGLPLVRVEPAADGSVKLTQQRFLNYGVKADPLLWKIPVSLKWSDGSKVHTQQIFMDGESATFKPDAKVAWFMPNVDGRGYYRWSAPQDRMLALSRASVTAMNPAERIAFLGNAQALLQAGEIRGDSYLRLLAAFSDDPDPLVASAVLDGLASAKAAFVPDDLSEAFGAYVRSTLSPMAKRFGLEKRAGEAEVVSLMRPQLFAWLGDEGNDPAALSLATRIANDYTTDPAKPDPSMVGAALQLTAMHGDRALFDRYRQAFEQAKTPSARQRYLGALGAVRDPALQDEALNYVLEGPVRVNEMRYITGGIRQQSDRAHDRVFAWLRANYAKVTAKIPEEFQASLPFYANGCSQERITIAKEFFSDPQHKVQGTEKELAQVVEEVGDCVGLRQREGAGVATYLRSLAAGSSKTAKSGSP